MFENLTNKFEEIFSSLKKSPSLDEKQVDEGLRNIRQALLEADVSLTVAKEFIANVKPKALGQEIVRSTSPGQMVVKIVYDELVKLLGENNSEININAVPPIAMMLVGFYVAKSLIKGMAQRKCISLECGLQNGTLAVFVATQLVDDIVYLVPTAAYALIMFVTSILFVFIVRNLK